MSFKKHLRDKKRRAGFISKPLICKIEISEHGKKVMDFKGDMGIGYKKFRAMCEELFQIKEAEEKTSDEYEQSE